MSDAVKFKKGDRVLVWLRDRPTSYAVEGRAGTVLQDNSRAPLVALDEGAEGRVVVNQDDMEPMPSRRPYEPGGLLSPSPPAGDIHWRQQNFFPEDSAARKEMPLCTGVIDYFPAALAAVAKVSKVGNDQHNPGQPLHWERGKSTDHADCIARHLADRGLRDVDGERHSAKLAWRALALLQTEIEEEHVKPVIENDRLDNSLPAAWPPNAPLPQAAPPPKAKPRFIGNPPSVTPVGDYSARPMPKYASPHPPVLDLEPPQQQVDPLVTVQSHDDHHNH